MDGRRSFLREGPALIALSSSSTSSRSISLASAARSAHFAFAARRPAGQSRGWRCARRAWRNCICFLLCLHLLVCIWLFAHMLHLLFLRCDSVKWLQRLQG